nr:digalactosyldiacylglycerol synthase 2, chloroplastic [Tanacetum cinerariifolium]
RSILALGDITESIPDEESDIAVLEEPEHLTWYHHGKRWKIKFRYVVGIVHTNYLEYVKREKYGSAYAFLLKYMNNWVADIYCHKLHVVYVFITKSLYSQ